MVNEFKKVRRNFNTRVKFLRHKNGNVEAELKDVNKVEVLIYSTARITELDKEGNFKYYDGKRINKVSEERSFFYYGKKLYM